MKRLTLIKAAADFAFAHYQDGPVTLVIESATAFKAADGSDDDFQIWTNEVNMAIAKFNLTAKQKLPSEIKAAQAAAQTAEPAAPAISPNVAAAVTPKQ